MSYASIGLIGLGVMGQNLVLNMVDKGFTVAVYNRTQETTDRFLGESEAQRHGLIGCRSPDTLVAALTPPRAVMLMVKAGDAVDDQIDTLTPLLAPGDILIDGGNANYRDTRRRCAAATEQGFHYLGVGVSGGEEGARHGPSVMAGGSREGFAPVADLFRAVAAKVGDAPCCAYLGSDGAGHFVKTMHNGIEYGDMQMIAEAYYVMRHGLGMPPAEIGAIFRRWNDGPLSSYLTEITGEVLDTVDPDTGTPLVDMILDRAGEKGTGRWASAEALDMGVPAPTIAEAVSARALSALKDQRVAAARLYDGLGLSDAAGPKTAVTIDALEGALLAGKIAAYAQGFAVLSAASQRWEWGLPLDEIARIWRGGCIIRSQFLDTIAAAYERDPALPNLLAAPDFAAIMGNRHGDLRQVVGSAVAAGLPVPALSSALAYFDSYRRDRLWADLIQAQRDYFGAHTFERVDRPGIFHFDWTAGSDG